MIESFTRAIALEQLRRAIRYSRQFRDRKQELSGIGYSRSIRNDGGIRRTGRENLLEAQVTIKAVAIFGCVNYLD